MRRNTATRTVALVGVLMLMIGACGGSSKPKATLELVAPKPGSTIKGNVVDLQVRATGIKVRQLTKKDTSGKAGRYHLFSDADPVGPGKLIPPPEKGIPQFSRSRVRVSGLSVGQHTFTVVLGDGQRRRIGTAKATAQVTVEGPSIKARVPGAVATGQPVNVTLEVQGVTIAPPDGDTSGKTGHVVLFIDRDPSPAGQPVPEGKKNVVNTSGAAATTPPLNPGAHSIWAVLVDGKNVPFNPPVEDRAVVSVT